MRPVLVMAAVASALAFGAVPRERHPEDRTTRTAKADTVLATGSFDVELTPEATDETDGSTLGRMAMGKRFHGDLDGSGVGEMLTAMTGREGSAGYVAIERFSGTLDDRRGTFVLQHSGTMNRGDQALSITIVPDSGTGDLDGIAGVMHVRIEEGEHFYELEYTLP